MPHLRIPCLGGQVQIPQPGLGPMVLSGGTALQSENRVWCGSAPASGQKCPATAPFPGTMPKSVVRTLMKLQFSTALPGL